jgi:hypothetical protein
MGSLGSWSSVSKTPPSIHLRVLDGTSALIVPVKHRVFTLLLVGEPQSALLGRDFTNHEKSMASAMDLM